MVALGLLLETNGKLGFNVKFLLEMGEETGSYGLLRQSGTSLLRMSSLLQTGRVFRPLLRPPSWDRGGNRV
ncbi:hypothetical protein [Sinorhizobium terangae]|uniref:hypothetical protein n=1 Tax=Sinorhizobium terangae TaxID=110322 RepID=UPI00307F6A7B